MGVLNAFIVRPRNCFSPGSNKSYQPLIDGQHSGVDCDGKAERCRDFARHNFGRPRIKPRSSFWSKFERNRYFHLYVIQYNNAMEEPNPYESPRIERSRSNKRLRLGIRIIWDFFRFFALMLLLLIVALALVLGVLALEWTFTYE